MVRDCLTFRFVSLEKREREEDDVNVRLGKEAAAGDD